MIDNLNVSYTQADMKISLSPVGTDMKITLSVPKGDSNLPHNISDVFTKIIHDSNANAQTVIEQLIDEFGYPEEGGDK